MKILCACEMSGSLRRELRNLGHDAWSCDLRDAMDNSPYHFKNDVFNVINSEWDAMVAFPPCTFLTVAGARHFKKRMMKQQESIEFVERLWFSPIKIIVIENPIGVLSTKSKLGKPTQIIQPWQHGHGETKAHCLWIRGTNKIVPSDIVDGRAPRVHHESPGIVNGLDRPTRRSILLPGIAKAIAVQMFGAA